MNSRRGLINTVLFFSIFVVSTLFHSEVGGPDSYYNLIDAVLVSIFVVINGPLDRSMVFVVAFPIAFLLLSVLGNMNGLPQGAYHSAGVTAVGLLLFALRPVPFNHALMRRLSILFLLGSLAISLTLSAQRTGLAFDAGNANFNVNPNAASLFFVACMVLALSVVEGALGWALTLTFMVLTVTTSSRAGAVCMTLLLTLYVLFHGIAPGAQLLRLVIRRAGMFVRVASGVLVLAALTAWIVPDAVNLLVLRFEVGKSRAEQWTAGWEGIDSLRGFLIGYGPTMLGLRLDTNPHNSYIDAIGSSGIFFLIGVIVAVVLWMRRLLRAQCWDILWILPPVLIYGGTETFLFNGLNSLWLRAVMVGLILHSRTLMVRNASLSAPYSMSPTPPQVVRRLVTARR